MRIGDEELTRESMPSMQAWMLNPSHTEQGIQDILDATLVGAYIHGYIADKLGSEVYILNARDVIKEIPKAINDICLK